MRVYIAGPMTGYKNFNREAFHKAEEKLKQKGCTVLNPAVLPGGLTQAQYMDICYRRIISDGRREFLASGKGKALVRMGLVEMKSDPVVFWFEKYQEGATA